MAQSVDKNFRIVRGSYPYVLRQLLLRDDGDAPAALQKLLVRLLTVNGQGEEIEWERLRDFLRLAQKATKRYDPSVQETETRSVISRRTVELFGQFLTSRTGIFLKKPLAHELAEAIDGMASIGEANLLRLSRGVLPILPGMNGPVNTRRMEELSGMVETFREALISSEDNGGAGGDIRLRTILELLGDMSAFMNQNQEDTVPMLQELQSVVQMVAVEVLEIRGARAIRSIVHA